MSGNKKKKCAEKCEKLSTTPQNNCLKSDQFLPELYILRYLIIMHLRFEKQKTGSDNLIAAHH